ncbi:MULTISPECIES: alpha/beta fold hydrolase [unclassified Crossiella]|uniref:alpha/beta fold hydrolase n=1 Tax=unclassified Crossiella TaxID=2620835 RepID=UPI001FFE4C01|nr:MULTISPECIES: alpha/beta hydrolase [unclassified Crossiella]MCK2236676.1 alpha/beta hydrolase [Crossiella sp. S99.2]MCK2250344.1 alpha/beta hydrolase [Crossiella sp. S99.1]
MSLAQAEANGVRWSAHGTGGPVTLLIPGLGATPGEARLPAVGLAGTRVVLTLPSHGESPDAPPGYFRYQTIAADVLAVADEVGATAAIGTSLGASALLAIAAAHPTRFERLALLIPAVLDQPRAVSRSTLSEQVSEAGADPLARMSEATEHALSTGDNSRLQAVVAGELPPGQDFADYVDKRVAALLRLREALTSLPAQVPVPDVRTLAEVTARVLVVSATGDPLHPEHVAKSVAAALALSRLEVLPSLIPLVTHRRELRALLADWAS